MKIEYNDPLVIFKTRFPEEEVVVKLTKITKEGLDCILKAGEGNSTAKERVKKYFGVTNIYSPNAIDTYSPIALGFKAILDFISSTKTLYIEYYNDFEDTDASYGDNYRTKIIETTFKKNNIAFVLKNKFYKKLNEKNEVINVMETPQGFVFENMAQNLKHTLFNRLESREKEDKGSIIFLSEQVRTKYYLINLDKYCGYLFHELTHLIANTYDVTNNYSLKACLKLAKEKPNDAKRNAQNWTFFASEFLNLKEIYF